MMRAVLMFVVCGSVAWTPVHAGPGEPVVADAQAPSTAFRYRSDHYRDPFVPTAVTQTPVGSSVQGQDVSPKTVKVVGTMLSAQGRWAVLEFEGGERLIVMPGQVISAYSRIVKRITEQGVTLSAIGDTAKPQAKKTYWLDEERDIGEPRSKGNS